MAGRKLNKDLIKYMNERHIDLKLSSAEGKFVEEVLGNDRFNLFRQYCYDAYIRHGDVGLGCFVAMFFDDGYVYPERKRLSETDETKWEEIKKEVFHRDNYTCAYCGCRGRMLEVDHKIPFSKGGTDDMGNLVTACRKCNRQKKDKTASEFMEWRGRRGKTTKKQD